MPPSLCAKVQGILFDALKLTVNCKVSGKGIGKSARGSAEPKWPGSRGHLGPGRVQGQSFGAYWIHLGACCELKWQVYTLMGVQFPCMRSTHWVSLCCACLP